MWEDKSTLQKAIIVNDIRLVANKVTGNSNDSWFMVFLKAVITRVFIFVTLIALMCLTIFALAEIRNQDFMTVLREEILPKEKLTYEEKVRQDQLLQLKHKGKE